MACDPFWNKTVLACHFDGTNGSTTFTDEKGHPLTANGNAQVSTAQSKFGGASLYLDGTGDYVSAANNTDYDFGSGDFTIEMRVRPSSLAATQCLISKRTDSGAHYRWILLSVNTNGTLNTQITTNGTSWAVNANTTSTISAGEWNHVALCRSGANVVFYVNGVANALSSTFSGSVYSSTEAVLIGCGGTTGAYINYANGHIDDLRITKAARYTTNFTPDTSAFVTNQCTISGTIKDSSGANAKRLVRVLDRKTCALLGTTLSDPTTGAYSIEMATTSEVMVVANDTADVDPYWSSVVLACHFDGANGSATFTDDKGHALTANGNAQISTAQSKFGGSSAYFDGTGDYILGNGSTDFVLGTGDFTIDFFVRPAAVNAPYSIIDFRPTSTGGFHPLLIMQSGGTLDLYVNNTTMLSVSHGMVANTWYHVALVRASGVSKFYVDGVQKGGSYADTNSYLCGVDRPAIGISGFSLTTNALNGYLDDLRITKAARYTANFTPPTAAFPNLLTGGTENAVILDRVVPA